MDYTQLQDYIRQNIRSNGAGGITGATLQDVCLEMAAFSNEHGGGGGGGPIVIEPITYSDLVDLKDNGELVPGTYYRITDYVCTVDSEYPDAQSAGHQFDVIVPAIDETTLSEEGFAALHEGDTYFAKCDLSKWKIWYCLENDTTKFTWADTVNGKGVIYRMIDEFNNDCPYDFKSIMFARYEIESIDQNLDGTQYDYLLSGSYLGTNGLTWNSLLSPTLGNVPKYFYTFSGVVSNGAAVIDYNTPVVDLSVAVYDIMGIEGNLERVCSNNVVEKYIDYYDSEPGQEDAPTYAAYLSYNVLCATLDSLAEPEMPMANVAKAPESRSVEDYLYAIESYQLCVTGIVIKSYTLACTIISCGPGVYNYCSNIIAAGIERTEISGYCNSNVLLRVTDSKLGGISNSLLTGDKLSIVEMADTVFLAPVYDTIFTGYVNHLLVVDNMASCVFEGVIRSLAIEADRTRTRSNPQLQNIHVLGGNYSQNSGYGTVIIYEGYGTVIIYEDNRIPQFVGIDTNGNIQVWNPADLVSGGGGGGDIVA